MLQKQLCGVVVDERENKIQADNIQAGAANKSSHAVIILVVYICTGPQQRPHNLSGDIVGGSVKKRGKTVAILDVDIGSAAEQSFQNQ